MHGGQEPPKGCTCDPSLAARRIHKMSCPVFTKPLPPEELEKQIAAIRIPGAYIKGHGQSYWSLPESTVQQLLALFAQHTQAAVSSETAFLKRLKLEFDANISVEAGERWSESDAAKMVNERLAQLEQRKKES